MNTKSKTAPKAKPVVADSITHAAALLGVDAATIRLAKSRGGDGFKGHRIDVEKLMTWLKANPEIAKESLAATVRKASASDLATRKLQAATELLEERLKRERNEVVAKATVQDEWARAISIIEDEARSLMEPDVFPVFISRIKAKIKA